MNVLIIGDLFHECNWDGKSSRIEMPHFEVFEIYSWCTNILVKSPTDIFIFPK